MNTINYWLSLYALLPLYIVLLTDPFYHVFSKLPGKSFFIRTRKPLLMTSFLFVLPHAALTLSHTNILTVSVITGFIALSALLLAMVSRIFRRALHPAGTLILIHASSSTMKALQLYQLMGVLYLAVLFLVGLEVLKLDRILTKKFQFIPNYLISAVSLPTISILLFAFYF